MNEEQLNRICNLALFIVQHDGIDADAMRDITISIEQCKKNNCTSFKNNILKLSQQIIAYICAPDKNTLTNIFILSEQIKLNASLYKCFEVGIDLQPSQENTLKKSQIFHKIETAILLWLKNSYLSKTVKIALQNKTLEFKNFLKLLNFIENEIKENRLEELISLLQFCQGIDMPQKSLEATNRVKRVFEREKHNILHLTQQKQLTEASHKFISVLRHPIQNLKQQSQLAQINLKDIATFYYENIYDISTIKY